MIKEREENFGTMTWSRRDRISSSGQMETLAVDRSMGSSFMEHQKRQNL